MTTEHPQSDAQRRGRPRPAALPALAMLGVTAMLLGGCVANAAPDADTIAVTATDTDCTVETADAASGTVTFAVTNDGSKVTEFYLLGDNELTIVGEVENIAPGATRDLTVQANPGDYFTSCKPGMIGAGVGQTGFTVTGDAVKTTPEDDAVIAQYIGYVKAQTEELVPLVEQFTQAYASGDDAEAKRLFPLARVNYERIEPTAEQFGDLDPKIDYRKPGADEEGLPFTGFHRIEMDLWHDEAVANGDYAGDPDLTPLTPEEREELGQQLVADVTELKDKVADPEFTLTLADITEGAKGLLDEIAAPDGKLPGEENEFAHTDLYDFTANVEGSQVAFDTVRDLAIANGSEDLVDDLDAQFTRMLDLLGEYGSYDDGFVFYDSVSQDERNDLAAQLGALSDPMSRLTAAVVSG